jgi:hypothetical protein
MKHYLSRLNEDPVNACGPHTQVDRLLSTRYGDARFNARPASPRSIGVGTNVSIDRRKSRLVATRGNDVGNNAATKLGRTLLDR